MFTSNDGLCKSAEPKFVEVWNKITKQQADDKATWIEKLRKKGVKAAHPDDGWVDRTNNNVRLTYPQFNDGVKPGDLIALGWPDKFRLVQVTGECKRWLSDNERYSFEPL